MDFFLFLKQGISLIPYDGLVLIISIALFGIIYFRLLESFKAKKEIIIMNIIKKIDEGILIYSHHTDIIGDAIKKLEEETSKEKDKPIDKEKLPDDKEVEDIENRINHLIELKKLISARYKESMIELQEEAKSFTKGGENELRRMRTLELERKDHNLDRILEVKGLMATRGIRINEYFGIR